MGAAAGMRRLGLKLLRVRLRLLRKRRLRMRQWRLGKLRQWRHTGLLASRRPAAVGRSAALSLKAVPARIERRKSRRRLAAVDALDRLIVACARWTGA